MGYETLKGHKRKGRKDLKIKRKIKGKTKRRGAGRGRRPIIR